MPTPARKKPLIQVTSTRDICQADLTGLAALLLQIDKKQKFELTNDRSSARIDPPTSDEGWV